MVRGGGDGVGTLGDHAGLGHVAHDLGAGQVAADAGLGALAHLYLDGGAGAQVLFLHAEAAGGHLHDGVGTVGIEVAVQAALAGVVAYTQRLGGLGQRRVGVVADGAVAHGREQDGHRQLQLGRQIGAQGAVRGAADGLGLFAQEHAGLHGLAERVDGRVGHLGGVDEYPVPVDRQGLGVAHGAEEHTAGVGLLVYLADGVTAPVGVVPEAVIVFHDLQGAGGTEHHAALAVDTFALVAEHDLAFGTVGVDAVGALALAGAAAGAAGIVPQDLKFRGDVVGGH